LLLIVAAENNIMREIWRRIEDWLEINAPESLTSLQSGAPEEELQEFENFLSVKLPEDVKESYRIHNGQNESLLFIDSRYFFTLEQIKSDWLNWKQMFESGDYHRESDRKDESDLEIKSGWWNPKWISLTNDAASNQNFLDLNPAKSGHLGQIVLISHGDEKNKKLVAKSFRDWLNNFADQLKTGKYGVADGDLVSIQELEDEEDEDE